MSRTEIFKLQFLKTFKVWCSFNSFVV